MSLFLALCTLVGFCFIGSFLLKVMGKAICSIFGALVVGGAALVAVGYFAIFACSVALLIV